MFRSIIDHRQLQVAHDEVEFHLKLQLKLKEAAHIRWTNPSLNRQLKHAELTLSF